MKARKMLNLVDIGCLQKVLAIDKKILTVKRFHNRQYVC